MYRKSFVKYKVLLSHKNKGQQSMACGPPIFVNNILMEHSQHSFVYIVSMTALNTTAELSSCERT